MNPSLKPSFDRNGYPTEITLQNIEHWEGPPWLDLMQFCQDAWSDYGDVSADEAIYWRFITGGWSGNEDIIAALESNLEFWSGCWVRSERGGVHEFNILPEKSLDTAPHSES